MSWPQSPAGNSTPSPPNPRVLAFSSSANLEIQQKNARFGHLLEFSDWEDLNDNMHRVEGLLKKGELPEEFLSPLLKKLIDYRSNCDKDDKALVNQWISKVTQFNY